MPAPEETPDRIWIRLDEAASRAELSTRTMLRLIERRLVEAELRPDESGTPCWMIRLASVTDTALPPPQAVDTSWALITGLASLLSALILFKSLYEDAVSGVTLEPASSLPERLAFNFPALFVWAVIAAGLGGVVWNARHHGSFLGGPGSEPQGRRAYEWGFVTNLSIPMTMLAMGLTYHVGRFSMNLFVGAAFLLGASIGAAAYFNTPIKGHQGARKYLDSTNLSSANKEFLLVLAWSGLIGLGGLGAAWTMRRLAWSPEISSESIAAALGLGLAATVFFTAVPVMLCVGILGTDRHYDSLRGFAAGVALRGSLFFSLFVCITR